MIRGRRKSIGGGEKLAGLLLFSIPEYDYQSEKYVERL
jgi:hypothetical protein